VVGWEVFSVSQEDRRRREEATECAKGFESEDAGGCDEDGGVVKHT
jgi:hypothetical protein